MLNRVSIPKAYCLIIPGKIRYYPMVWLDMPQIWERANQKKHQDFSPEIETAGYPSYYLQTSIIRRMATLVIYQPISMTYRLTFSLVAQPIDAAANHRSVTAWAESFDSVTPANTGSRWFGTGRTLKLSVVLCLKHLCLVQICHPPTCARQISYCRKFQELQLLHANAEEPPTWITISMPSLAFFSSMSYQVQCVSR